MFIGLCLDLAESVIRDILTYANISKDKHIKSVANYRLITDIYQSGSIN
jgi:hypothetical protein